MPAHKAHKAADRNTDRLANLTIATFVVLAAVGVTTDAIARPRPLSRRDDFIDDLLRDSEDPGKAVSQLAREIEPHSAPRPRIAVSRSEPARAPLTTGKHRKPGRAVTMPQQPVERSAWGRQHVTAKRRIAPKLARILIALSADYDSAHGRSRFQASTGRDDARERHTARNDGPAKGVGYGLGSLGEAEDSAGVQGGGAGAGGWRVRCPGRGDDIHSDSSLDADSAATQGYPWLVKFRHAEWRNE